MYLLPWAINAVGGKRGPKPIRSCKGNMVSPYRSLFRESRPQGRPIAMRVRDEGESEGRAVIARIGVATSLYAKAGRLPSGLSSRNSLAKTTQGARQMTAEEND